MIVALVCVAAVVLSFQTPSQAPSALVSHLRSKDQALLDAVALGDRAVWERTLSADAIYVDENGKVMTRAELLKELGPLPAGVSGNIAIVDYSVRVAGDTAMVIHRDDEKENFHGQQLTAQYLTTETWVRQKGEWLLAMVHVYSVNRDPPSVKIPDSQLDEYVGRYSAAKDLFFVIRRDGDQLVGGREGGTVSPLLIETRDVLFSPGRPRVRK